MLRPMYRARRKRRDFTHQGRRLSPGLVFVVLLAAIVALPAVAAEKPTAKPPALPTSCTELGIYRDDPTGTFPSLAKSFGQNLTTLSTYVTAGHGLDPKLAALARCACSCRGCRTRGATSPSYRSTRWRGSPAARSTPTCARSRGS